MMLFSACTEDALVNYTVSFETNGGSEVASIVYTDGDAAITLPTPTRDGFTFIGWYTDAALKGKALGETYVPTADVTLYARWTYDGGARPADPVEPTDPVDPDDPVEPDEPDVHSLRFVTNSDDDFDAIAYRGEAITLPEPYKYGYVFTGWYLDARFSGEAVVSPYAFDGDEDVTLYAKYREVSYVYLYYGVDDFDSIKWTKEIGDEIRYEDLPTPDAIVKNGVSCPFVKWTLDYEGKNDMEAPIVANGIVCLYAQYDKSEAPVHCNMIDNGDGTYTTTSNGIYQFFHRTDATSIYSFDMGLPKQGNGSAGIAFRMTLGDRDYPYELGQDYLSAVLNATKGYLEVSQVTDGVWKRIGNQIPLTSLPQGWQEKFSHGDTVTLTVVDLGTSFEIYLDGELVFTCTDATMIASHTGTGCGIRSSCYAGGVEFSNISYRSGDALTISFDSNGGTTAESIQWVYGPPDLPTVTKAGWGFLGWYYDAALTRKVSTKDFSADADITLYAGWRYPLATGATKNEDGTWVTSSNTTSAGKGQNSLIVDGILRDRSFEISADITFIKGNSSSVGIMFYGSVNSDYGWEAAGDSYMAVQIVATTGELRISTFSNSKYAQKASANLTQNTAAKWRDKYNAASVGDTIAVTLKVVSDGESLLTYIDGELAYKYVGHADILQSLTGMAYGARANSAGATIKFTVSYTGDSNEEGSV